MKRLFGMILLTGILAAMAITLPITVEHFLPQITVVTLQEEVTVPKVYAAGKLEERNQKEITCELPVVPKAVYVEAGDWVETGEVLATIDTEQTLTAILNLTKATEYLPQSVLQLLEKVDLEMIAAQIPQEVIATASGMISTLNLDAGTVVYPTQAVATISPNHEMRAKLSVLEEYANEIKPGQPVTVKISALDDQQFAGRVSYIFSGAQQVLSGTSQETVVNIYVELISTAPELKAGYTVSGEIFTGGGCSILTLPYPAINQDESGQEYVYLYRSGKAVRQDITIGEELETSAEILSGISKEDYVISDCSLVSQNGAYVHLTGEV